MNIIQSKGRPLVAVQTTEYNIAYHQPFYMPGINSVSRQRMPAVRIWIHVDILSNFFFDGFLRTTTPVHDADVVQRQVLDVMTGDSHHHSGTHFWEFWAATYIVNNQVADGDTPVNTHRISFWASHPRIQPYEKRCVGYIAHSNVVDYNVFNNSTDGCFNAKPARMFENTVGNRDVFKAAIRFCSQFQPAGDAVFGVWVFVFKSGFESTVHQNSVVATHAFFFVVANQNHSVIEVQRYFAFQVKGKRKIFACRKENSAAAIFGCRINSPIDGIVLLVTPSPTAPYPVIL